MTRHTEKLLLTYSMALTSSQNLGLRHDAHSSLLFDVCLQLFPFSSHKSFSISFSHVNLGHQFLLCPTLSLNKLIIPALISSFHKLSIQHPLLGFFDTCCSLSDVRSLDSRPTPTPGGPGTLSSDLSSLGNPTCTHTTAVTVCLQGSMSRRDIRFNFERKRYNKSR
jgi:hypothetical protein